MHHVVQVGDARVAVVHGDAVSLAGWGFARRTLATAAGARRAAQWLCAAQADVFACTHTCEPLWLRLSGDQAGVVVNNGAAGMPNFQGARHGLLTRIATTPPPAGVRALYGGCVKEAHVHAVALDYDQDRWWSLFESLWPPGSPAHASYASRWRRRRTESRPPPQCRSAPPTPFVPARREPRGGT
jgi:hypothetical protein